MGIRELCELARVETVREGDRVHFEVPAWSYLVERVDETGIGMIRHAFGDETGSRCYWGGELVYVEREQ